MDVNRAHRRLSFIDPDGFTLIELLVVIAVIAVLLAIFIPVTRAARECGQRAVCLSNLRQLTMAWITYGDEHDSKIVLGGAFVREAGGEMEGWLGAAFSFPENRSAVIENPYKGGLWPYLRDMDVYRCPGGWAGHAATYAAVSAVNGPALVEGTYAPGTEGSVWAVHGKRVGNTVLRLNRLTDIISPGGGQRAVFIDQGFTPSGSDFRVHYLHPKWERTSPPPIHHAGGVTLSMADGHAEYWKWKGRETLRMPRTVVSYRGLFLELLRDPTYEPKTEDGLYDLQRLQRATWGGLGYPSEDTP